MGLDVVGRRKSKVTIFTTVPWKKNSLEMTFLEKNIPWKKHSSEKTFLGSKIHWKKIPWNDIPWNKFPCSVVQPQALPQVYIKCMFKMQNFAGSRKVAHILKVWSLLSAKIPISSRSVENPSVITHSPSAPLVLTNSAQFFPKR
jgi:hypothetical protein